MISLGMNFKASYDSLKNEKNVSFNDLLKIAREAFGEPRINGTSHHVFKVPWPGKPWVNLQRDGKHAKPYQVKQVLDALKKLEEIENEKSKTNK
jgi:hypothetical protein